MQPARKRRGGSFIGTKSGMGVINVLKGDTKDKKTKAFLFLLYFP
jgi:hypothetical protein